MNIIRNRAQEQFPTVLLTLLSIVQALALELLWEHIQESEYLFQATAQAFVSWAQISTTLFGIILIWVAYASHAMRFRWTPSTADSVYPFIIGLLEFIQIETLAPGMVGQWTVILAIILGIMVFVSHLIMRRARTSGANGDFFTKTNPATAKDFFAQITIVILLLLGGSYVWLSDNNGIISYLLIGAVFMVLVWQYISSARFWNSSLSDSQ
ncbi:MAG: hypothetical protein ACI9WC_003267 [Arenicella sp.]|jgi:hypothetical protein